MSRALLRWAPFVVALGVLGVLVVLERRAQAAIPPVATCEPGVSHLRGD